MSKIEYNPREPLPRTSTVLVIFHSPCHDGYAAWHFISANLQRATPLALSYRANQDLEKVQNLNDMVGILGDDAKDLSEYDCVVLVDITLPTNAMNLLFKNARRIVWLDHHEALMMKVFNELGGNEFLDNRYLLTSVKNTVILDTERSGALLAATWLEMAVVRRYLPEGTCRLARIIDDYDRWQHRSKISKPLVTYLTAFGFDPKSKAVSNVWNDAENDLVAIGDESWFLQTAKSFYENTVAKAKKTAEKGICGNIVHKDRSITPAFFVCSTDHPDMIADQIEDHAVVAVWCHTGGKIKVSFRRRTGSVDMNEIATKFGGGGHKGAAGAYINAKHLVFDEEGIQLYEEIGGW